MSVRRKKGFTLIELIAVLVIMAIITLIVTPLVMNVIRQARVSADKRSIDAYGRSIELAIASYLLDNGKFPTDVSQLTVEYSGNQVVCETTQLNPDSSVYLTGCTVAGRSTGDYVYGSDKSPIYIAYSVGDEVTYNGVTYYVIKDSGIKKSTVTLLKAEPLTVEEVNTYGGVGTTGHVNRYSGSPQAFNRNGYGSLAYYASETCGNGTYTGCTNSYESSEIKYVVDAWKTTKAPSAIEARLMTYDEYTSNCIAEEYQISMWGDMGIRYVPKYDWMYNTYYSYFLGTPDNDSVFKVWYVPTNGKLEINSKIYIYNAGSIGCVVRPVIVLPKSAISS